MANNNDGQIVLGLDIPKTVSQINADIKKLQNQLEQVKATGALDTSATVKQINAQIASLQSQLKTINIKANIDTSNAQKTGQKIGQTVADSAQKTIDGKNINVDKLNADIKTLTNNLNNFSSKNAGFDTFKTEINGVEVSLDSLIQKLSIVDNTTDLSTIRSQANALKSAFTELQEVNKIQLSMGVNGDTTSKIEVLRNNFTKLGLSADEVKTKMSGVDTEVKTLQSLMNSGADNSAIVTQFEKLQTVLTQTQNNLKQTRSDYSLLATEQQRLSLANTIEAWNQKNTAATKKVRAENDRYVASLRDLNTEMTKLQFGQIQTGFKQAENSMRTLNRLGASLKDQMKQAANSFTQWISVSSAIMGVVYSTKQAVSELKDVNTYLTEISKANDQLSKTQLKQIGNSSFDVAGKYGKKATDYLSGVQEASRAGYVNAEGIAELSVAAQGAGDMTAELANQYIIATDKAYKLGGSVEKLTEVLDGSNYITNHNAVNMTELAEGMSIVGSQASSLGVGVDQTTAALGTMIATTQQSGSEMARAFKAILLNIQQVSDEEEGIDAEGITKYEKACNALNVSLKETKNGVMSLRDPMEVIKDLSEEYTKLDANDIRRTNLLSSVGGKLRANALNALLENYDMYSKMLEEYSQGTGSMAQEAEKTSKSWEGSMNRLSNTWTKVVGNIANSDAIIGAVNGLNSLLSVIDKITSSLGSLGTIGLGAGIFAGIKNAGIFKTINDEVGQTKVVLNDTVKSLFNGNLFKKESLLSQSDISALQAYNAELERGVSPMTAYYKTMQNASDAAVNMASSANGATVSISKIPKVSKAAELGLKALSIAGNMLMFWAITEGIQLAVKALDKLILTTEEAKEALDNSVSSFQGTTDELNNLESELETTSDRLGELQKLAENNSISIAEERELELLKQQNDELVRKIALKKEEQVDAAKQVLKDAKKYSDKEVMSSYAYVSGTYEQGAPQYDSISAEDELSIAFDKYYSSTNRPSANQQNPKDVIENMYAVIEPTIEAYEALIDADYKLSNEEQAHYDKLRSLQDRYLQYRYDLNGLKETYQALSIEQQKNILLNKLTAQGLSDIQANAVLDSVSESDYASLWEKGFSFTPPQMTDYATAEEYGKAYANAWLNGVKSGAGTANETDILSFSEAWEKLKNSTDDATKGLADNLTELAESGKLTVEALSKADSTEYFENLGISAEEAVKKINELVSASTQLQSMSTQISKMSDMLADKKNGTVASASDLAGFDVEVRGLDSWKEFESVMGSTTSTMEECQSAANALATEWVNNGNFLANLTDETKQAYITQLDKMGVDNAEAIVEAVLTQKHNEEALALQYSTAATAYNSSEKGRNNQITTDLINVTGAEITQLLNEGKVSVDTANDLAAYVVQKKIASGTTLNTAADIKNLADLAGASTKLGKLLNNLAKIKQGFTNGMPSDVAAAQAESLQKQIEVLVGGGNNTAVVDVPVEIKPTGSGNYKPSGGSGGSRGGSRGGSKTKETKQTIDWIDRKITILNNKIDAFATKASDAWSSWTSRTKALNSEMETTKKLLTSVYGVSDKLQKKYNKQKSTAKIKLDNYVKDNSKVLTSSTIKKINNGTLDTSKLSKKDKKVVEKYKKLQKDYEKKAKKASQNPAADYYFSKANSVAKKYKLSPAIIKKIKNGTISISDYNESMANAIQKYQDYYDKGKDAQKSKKEAKQKLNELAQQNFELIQSKWDSRIGYQENRKNAVSDALNLAQSKGKLIGTAYYTKQKGINNKEINKYKQEETELKKAMKGVKKYSEQWYQYKADLSEVHSKYVQLQADNAELQNSINELKFDRFDELINKFNDIIDESDFLIGLLDSDNLFNSDNGSITNDGITAMGLTAQNYDVYLAQAEQYKKQIADLEQMYKNGNGTIGYNDYISKLREYQQGMRNSIKSANDAKKAVIDYVKQGLDAQNEALSNSIDKQKELLESEKDLHDFQSKIADQNKNIANLRKQIAALEGDSSESNRKKLQQLKSDLQDAEKEQADTLYDRSVSDQEKALDDMLTKSQDAAESYLKDSEKVFIDALNYVNKNTSQVSQNLEKISKDLGFDISTYITNAWKDGGDAVGTYESTLSSNVPKITAQIQLITNAWNAQCEAANKAAQASANAAAGTDETTKDTDKKGNSSNGSGNKSKTSSAKDIKNFIQKSLNKAGQKKSYYGALNRYLYEKTGGKVLSVSEEVQLAKMLGVSVKKDLSGTGDRQKILDALKKKKIAFANGGVLGDLVKLSGEDGLFIGSAGESILTKEQTQALINFRPVIPQLNTMVDFMKNVPISRGATTSEPHIEINTTVEGVATDQIVKQMEGVAQRQAENVVRKINSATYAKGVRR